MLEDPTKLIHPGLWYSSILFVEHMSTCAYRQFNSIPPMIKGNSLARVSGRACLRVLTMPLMLSGLVGATQSIRGLCSRQAHTCRLDSLSRMLTSAGHDRIPIVALFSRAGVPGAEALRREQLVHLARNADTRGVRVVEFDIADQRAFVRPERPERPDHTARQRRPDSSQNRTDPRPAHDGTWATLGGRVAGGARRSVEDPPCSDPGLSRPRRRTGRTARRLFVAGLLRRYLDQLIHEARRALRAAN